MITRVSLHGQTEAVFHGSLWDLWPSYENSFIASLHPFTGDTLKLYCA